MKSHTIRVALLCLWLGAMAFFSFVVAPSAFAVLPLPQLAGALVSRALGALEVIGIVIGALLILILVFSRERSSSKARLFELVTLALMTVSMLVSRFVVSKWMQEMRASFGEISQLAATDPTRVSFDRLHQYSVLLMGFDILAAIVLIIFLARRDA